MSERYNEELNNNDETLEMWKDIIREIEIDEFSKDYDFLNTNLTIHLDFFNDIPTEHKKNVIEKFAFLVSAYVEHRTRPPLATEEKMHNKWMKKSTYNLLQRDLRTAKRFLQLAEKNNQSDDFIEKIKTMINHIEYILNLKRLSKTKIKSYLLKVNTDFNLKKTLEVKQLTDIIYDKENALPKK